MIVGRDAWGAVHPAGFGARALPLAQVWLHHTVTLAPDLAYADLNGDSVDDDEAAAMRQLEQIGQARFGGGFSYNLAVMPSGRAYVGCGVDRIGAHTAGRNTASLGVCLVGDYSTRTPPPAMQATLVELLRLGKLQGWLTAPRFTGGHRDAPGSSTACPGNAAYALLGQINALAGQPPTPDDDDEGELAMLSPATIKQLTDALAPVVRAEVNRVAALLIRGDHPDPKGGDTHPDNLARIRVELAAIADRLPPTDT